MFNSLPLLLLIALPLASAWNFSGASQWEFGRSHDVEPWSFGLTGRIVNGTKASTAQFPHQVSLRRSYSSSHFCGGSILTEHLVVTAAHCMFLSGMIIQPWTIMIVAGELKLNEASTVGQRRGVGSIIIHPGFNYATLQNDIAVLVLTVPLTFTKEVNKVIMPPASYVPGRVCQVSGWGYPASNIPIVSNDLMYVGLPIMNRTLCKELLKEYTTLPPGMFCAGYMEGKKDACQGDSGGGMVCGKYLTGVVSGGQGCAEPRLPGAYTDIFYYRFWLANYTTMPAFALGSFARSDAGSLVFTSSFVLLLCSIFFVVSIGNFKF